MIIVLATMVVKPEKKGALAPLTLELILKTRNEDGCISYELLSKTDNENTQTFVEKWESMDALKLHMQTPHFLNFGEKTKDFFIGDMNIEIFDAVKK